MDQLRNAFPFKYSKRLNVVLALIAMGLIAPVAVLPVPLFRDLFTALLKIAQSGGNLPS
jgi:hypothetical protein